VRDAERERDKSMSKIKEHRDQFIDKMDNQLDVLLRMSRSLQELSGFDRLKSKQSPETPDDVMQE
jgi:hypothetical protein